MQQGHSTYNTTSIKLIRFDMHTNYLPSHPQAWSPQTAMDLLHFHEEDTKEHMFEKPLTPSDVGKLNRLVIPKQFAEKYFPLAGESGEKGLLLNFEDEAGKPWRFRYSYWTSSQSYVLTKGWSRFVKDKQLDAGDVVLFQRRRGDHLLYIGCRRRGDTQISHVASRASAPPQPWSPLFFDSTSSSSPPGFYIHEGRQSMGGAGESAAATKPLASKRLRLFGVNLDCVP